MKVIPFIYNDIDDLNANTYLLVDNSSFCVVIDPSQNNDKLGDYISNNNLILKAVLLTHGHVDHIRGIDRLVERFKAEVFIHYLDESLLTNPRYNLSSYMGENVIVKSSVKTVTDGDVIKVLDEDIKVVHTPFHTEGSVCYFLKESKLLFSGDTLFKRSIGRDDFEKANRHLRRESLEKLMAFSDDIKVYPGHGGFTTIGFERNNNPFVK